MIVLGCTLTAVKQANGIDWWIIVPQYLSNKYYTFKLTENGIQNLFEQQISFQLSNKAKEGQVFFSRWEKYIKYTPDDYFI